MKFWVGVFAVWLIFFGLVTAAVLHEALLPPTTADHYCPPDPKECG